MVAAQIKRLVGLRAKVTHLEKAVAAGLSSELKRLPKRYGFADVNTFIRAVTVAGRSRKRHSHDASAKQHRRRRSIITKAMRAAVRNLAHAGKKRSSGNGVGKC